MGKDNITFHSQIWPAELLGYAGKGEPRRRAGGLRRAEPADRGRLERVPHDGGQAVLDLARLHDPRARRARALRARRASATSSAPPAPRTRTPTSPGASSCSATTPSSSPAGATWSTRTAAMVAKNFGEIPQPGRSRAGRRGGARHGARRVRHRGRPARAPPPEGRDRGGDARRRRGQRLRLAHRAVQAQGRAPARAARDGAAHARAVRLRPATRCSRRSCRTRPTGSTRCWAATARSCRCRASRPWRAWTPATRAAPYPVITGDYSATPRWESRPVVVGTPISKPAPVFTKLDESVVDEELAAGGGGLSR